MNVQVVPQQPARRERAIALHCSGAGASQWRFLKEALGPHYEVLMPEHYGCESTGQWTGEHAFTLADDAARSIALIDESDENVHLVGHSYGGGVALYVALSRPDRIATMTKVTEMIVQHIAAVRTQSSTRSRPIKSLTGSLARLAM